MTNVIYLAHTIERSKLDVRFSILCLLHHSARSSVDMRIIVVTDHPEWFDDLPIMIEAIDQSVVKEWKGEFEFLHRMKIMAIMQVRNKYNGDLLYMDGDTCLTTRLDLILRHISSGNSLMHENEGRLIDRTNITLKRTYDFFQRHKSIVTSFGELRVAPEQTLYNAGVIGISRSDSALLEEVLVFNDTLYPLYRNHVTEQLMFSHVLSMNTHVHTCDDEIYHWWGRSEQTGIMLSAFFEKHKDSELEDRIDNAHQYVHMLKTAQKDRMTFLQNLGRSLEKRRKRIKMMFKR